MSDVLAGRRALAEFRGVVACGGFSYGDVLGAGGGWAKSILFNAQARAQFQEFFARPDTFTLGVCNGCQMLANLKSIIPGADHWPRFVQNLSEQYEARLSLVEILDSSSVLMRGMAGSRHADSDLAWRGARRVWRAGTIWQRAWQIAAFQCAMWTILAASRSRIRRIPMARRKVWPGSARRTGVSRSSCRTPNACFERSCTPGTRRGWGEDGPWMRLFQNARAWVG